MTAPPPRGRARKMAPPSRGPGIGAKTAQRSASDIVDAQRVREDRQLERAREIATIASLNPACEIATDPPVVWTVPQPIASTAKPGGLLASFERSGRGAEGASRLCVVGREYDGAGPNGGEARRDASLWVRFAGRSGHDFRTMGVAIHEAELRAVARALVALADALEGQVPSSP